MATNAAKVLNAGTGGSGTIFGMPKNTVYIVGGILAVILVIYVIYQSTSSSDTPTTSNALNQVVALANARQDGHRPMNDMILMATSKDNSDVMPEFETSLVNFYSLGCRFAGYLGPFQRGSMDPKSSVKYALDMGCRTFILEIGFISECSTYYPQVIIRDKQGVKQQSSVGTAVCETDGNSSIRDVCQALMDHAFDDPSKGPLILVLYILELPPFDAQDPHRTLMYYSNIAKGLAPLIPKRLENIANGGTFSKHQQEALLISNKITDYNDRVIVMCNTDTSVFDTTTDVTVEPNENLDNWVNLQLFYRDTPLGATAKVGATTTYGILDTVEAFSGITDASKINEIVNGFKPTWTVCMERDPSNATAATDFQKLTSTFGINCIPIQIWNPDYNYLFEKNKGLFAKYSFVPKPAPLRYRKPGVAIAPTPNPKLNANQGALRSPT